MLELITSYLPVIAIVIFTIAIFFLLTKLVKLNSTVSKLTLQYSELKQLLEAAEDIAQANREKDSVSSEQQAGEIKEINEVTRHLEHRISQLQKALEEQNQRLEGLQTQEPQDKLYSRAQKMVALGADVEEIMTECELPRAEAEMLVAMHQKKQTQS